MNRQIHRTLLILTLSIVLAAFASLSFQANAAPPAGPAKPAAASSATRDFSFVHISDIHISPEFHMPTNFEKLRSYPCVATLKNLGAMLLKPYDVTAPKPSFAIATGDITEFGDPGVTWQVVDKYFQGVSFPVHMIPGNHDNTWVATPEEYRKRFGGINYSFDYQGVHFVGLCSATLQDPVPSFGEEEIRFLKNDLAKVGPATPVIVFFHHPLHGREFASRYDVDRLLDAMRPYNVVLTLDGHGHASVRHKYFQLDGIEGGSPFARRPGPEGYNIVYIKGDHIYAAYRRYRQDSANKPMIEKTIPARSDYPAIAIQSPAEGQKIAGSSLTIDARIAGAPTLAAVRYSLDDEDEGNLQYSNGTASGRVDLSGVTNGAHFLRVVFGRDQDTTYTHSVAFVVESAKGKGKATARWRYQLAGASKATPLLLGGIVYLGADDGRFYALDAKTGRLKWTFDAGSQILTSAATLNNLIFFGAADGTFYALNPEGKLVWKYKTDAAVFSSPVVDPVGDAIYFGTNDARLVALRAKDGKPLWVNSDARFSVESKPYLAGGKVYFGAWDGYIYSVDAKTGKTLWKKPGPRNQKRVITYYAPADDGPVATPNGTVFVCDRGYKAGRYSPTGEYEKTISDDASALTLSPDGKSLYIRSLRQPVSKTDFDGNAIWKSTVVAGRIPVGPTVRDGKVYVCTNTGHLHVLDDKTGQELWDYQVEPRLYVMAGVGAANGIAYTVGMDGVVTAVGPAE